MRPDRGNILGVLKARLRWLRGPYHRYGRKGALLVLGGVARRLPGDSLTFGPPRRAGAVGDPARPNAGIAAREVVPSERLVFTESASITPNGDFWGLVDLSPDSIPLPRTPTGARYVDIPPGAVYTISGGRALGAEGFVLDGDDRLLLDLSPDYIRERYIRSRHTAMHRLRLPPAFSVSGQVAALATLSAPDYYGHWMMDLVPRAAMIKRAGFSFAEMTGVYLPRPRHQYQVDLLTRLGIDLEQVIDADTVPHLRAEQLIVASCYGNVFAPSAWCCDTLRDLAGPPDEERVDGARLIYVSRSRTSHRRVANEDELRRTVLGPRGFTPVWPEDHSVAEQARIFAAAEVVVTPLGSSVANLVHCRPGTQIVEIMNPRCVQTCALGVASQRGLGHHVVLADGVDPTEHEIREDLVVAPEHLERGIEEALAARGRATPLERPGVRFEPVDAP